MHYASVLSYTHCYFTFKIIDEVNAHNSTNVDIATVNSILTQLDMLTNGTTQFGIPELSNILLNVSKWKTSNKATIEVIWIFQHIQAFKFLYVKFFYSFTNFNIRKR